MLVAQWWSNRQRRWRRSTICCSLWRIFYLRNWSPAYWFVMSTERPLIASRRKIRILCNTSSLQTLGNLIWTFCVSFRCFLVLWLESSSVNHCWSSVRNASKSLSRTWPLFSILVLRTFRIQQLPTASTRPRRSSWAIPFWLLSRDHVRSWPFKPRIDAVPIPFVSATILKSSHAMRRTSMTMAVESGQLFCKSRLGYERFMQIFNHWFLAQANQWRQAQRPSAWTSCEFEWGSKGTSCSLARSRECSTRQEVERFVQVAGEVPQWFGSQWMQDLCW